MNYFYHPINKDESALSGLASELRNYFGWLAIATFLPAKDKTIADK
jgi:hypothetical protein